MSVVNDLTVVYEPVESETTFLRSVLSGVSPHDFLEFLKNHYQRPCSSLDTALLEPAFFGSEPRFPVPEAEYDRLDLEDAVLNVELTSNSSGQGVARTVRAVTCSMVLHSYAVLKMEARGNQSLCAAALVNHVAHFGLPVRWHAMQFFAWLRRRCAPEIAEFFDLAIFVCLASVTGVLAKQTACALSATKIEEFAMEDAREDGLEYAFDALVTATDHGPLWRMAWESIVSNETGLLSAVRDLESELRS